VAERVVPVRGDVSVGTHPAATLQLDVRRVPKAPTWLRVATSREGVPHIVLPPDPGARVLRRHAGPGGTEGARPYAADIDGGRDTLLPMQRGEGLSLALSDDLVVMMQAVPAPAVDFDERAEPILRVGLVHRQRLLTERVVATDTPQLRIGAAATDDLVLPDDEYTGSGVSIVQIEPGVAELRASLTRHRRAEHPYTTAHRRQVNHAPI
jgi:hypothetical protein